MHALCMRARAHAHMNTRRSGEGRLRLSRHTNTQETRQKYTHIDTHKNALSLARALARALSLPYTRAGARHQSWHSPLVLRWKVVFFKRAESRGTRSQAHTLFLSLSLSPPALSLSVFLPLTPPPLYTRLFSPLFLASAPKAFPLAFHAVLVSRMVRTICFLLLLFLHQPHREWGGGRGGQSENY